MAAGDESSYYGQIDGWRHGPPRRIDYVFKRNGAPLQVVSIDFIFNGYFYPVVSDHFGLFARFQMF